MRSWTIVGFLATAVIAMALPLYAFNEAGRMGHAQTDLLIESVTQGQIHYAENCVVCHGANGQGISAYPGLDNDGIRGMEYETLFKVIERGRYETAMAAWGVNEGGVLNDMEINQLITMLQSGDWTETAQTVESLGLSPPTVVSAEVPAEALAEIAMLPRGQLLAAALPLYGANCAGCHGPAGEGTALAPALNDAPLRSQRTDEDLRRTIVNGVPGTLMAGWDQALTPDEIDTMIGLVRYWHEVPAGIIPQPDLAPIASTDAEVIAAGEKLYSIACANCHGREGQGTRMAPSLNVKSFLTETNDQALKAIIAQGVPDTRMPAWGGRLTDDELNSLISFLRTWEGDAPAVAEPARGSGGQGSQGGPGNGPSWLRWVRRWFQP